MSFHTEYRDREAGRDLLHILEKKRERLASLDSRLGVGNLIIILRCNFGCCLRVSFSGRRSAHGRSQPRGGKADGRVKGDSAVYQIPPIEYIHRLGAGSFDPLPLLAIAIRLLLPSV